MPNNLYILGHRGKGPTSNLSTHVDENGLGYVPKEHQPENTLPAFEQAFKEDADGIELDIFISKDGIPMVIHDNELNRNISGAKRKDTNLGMLENYTAQELRNFDVGQGLSMPTLQEVIELVAQYNLERKANNQPPLVLNIELKGKDSAAATMQVLNGAFRENLINRESVMFCSFNYDTLRELRKLDDTIKIAPSIRTTLLYGQDNVDKNFKIKEGASMDPKGLEKLRDLHKEINLCAFDAVLWDIDKPLINLCIQCGIGLCASTSDFRAKPDDIGIAYNQFLVRVANILDKHNLALFFKSDEAGLMRKEIKKIDDAYSVPLEDLTIVSTRLITNSIDEEKKHMEKEELERLPKPDISYSDSYMKSMKRM